VFGRKQNLRLATLKSWQDFATMVFLLYVTALYFITRCSALPRKTVLWMLITLFVTLAAFIGLAMLSSSPEAVRGLGRLGGTIGMIASIGVGLMHIRLHKRPRSERVVPVVVGEKSRLH
jgi:hypothetical protein